MIAAVMTATVSSDGSSPAAYAGARRYFRLFCVYRRRRGTLFHRFPGQLMHERTDEPDYKHQKSNPDKDDDKSQQCVQCHRSDSGILISLGEGGRFRQKIPHDFFLPLPGEHLQRCGQVLFHVLRFDDGVDIAVLGRVDGIGIFFGIFLLKRLAALLALAELHDGALRAVEKRDARGGEGAGIIEARRFRGEQRIAQPDRLGRRRRRFSRYRRYRAYRDIPPLPS